MSRILHFSDLHLEVASATQDDLFDSMASALPEHAGSVDMVAITGDVFQSAALDPDGAIGAFRRFYDQVVGVLGRKDVPVVVLPGNHDVRREGVFGPDRPALFHALRGAMAGKNVVVHDDEDFLMKILPQKILPADVVLVNSAYLAHGFISAGGIIRQEDLLHVAARLPPEPDRPLILFCHHHLVPQAVADFALVELAGDPGAPSTQFLNWVIQHGLALAVPNADYQEMTMTALGAGTALTTLHTFGRPVLVLHGHKHFPAARLLRGIYEEQGDVMLVAAGSAGTAEPWRRGKYPDDARLWPSFNIVDVDAPRLLVTSCAYPPAARGHGRPVLRTLVDARYVGATWQVPDGGVAPAPTPSKGPHLTLNRATYALIGADPDAPLWDAFVTRAVEAPEPLPFAYSEVVEAAPGASVDHVSNLVAPTERADCPATIKLRTGEPGGYRLIRGFCGTIAEARRRYGARTAPYDWVDLFNRYRSDHAELILRGFPRSMKEQPFAARVDLTTGQETPERLARAGGDYVLSVPDCPPRTLLRIFWPLTSRASDGG